MVKPPSPSLERLGWGLFTLSSLLFVVSTARSGDWLGLGGSVLFLLGCLAFVVPLMKP